MKNKYADPIDASSIILVDESHKKLLWALRNPGMRFLGGYHSFTGGKVEPGDTEIKVKNCTDSKMATSIVCAVRETFEEIGVLLARNGERLTKGQYASLHDDLNSGRSSFREILETWGLEIDLEDFHYAGTWTTPEFSQIRFKTEFYVSECPGKQIPYSATSEMLEVDFIDPREALEQWSQSKVLIVPPVLFPIQEFAKASDFDLKKTAKQLARRSERSDKIANHIDYNSRFSCIPLETKTLPPATHTNCFIVGGKRFIVIDAATPFEDEQNKLFKLVDQMIEKGFECVSIIVSHLHPDHFGGETALKKHLLRKYNLEVPIAAHQYTAESLDGQVDIEILIEDGQTYDLIDSDGEQFKVRALHTPGHARGHLCFYDEELGFLLSSDNVVGLGTVVIAPPEGNMIDYLKSLRRMKDLPNLNFLCGSHGPAVFGGVNRIEAYIDHRKQREDTILQLVSKGVEQIDEIVDKIYKGLESKLLPLAKKSVQAHLEKLETEGKISSPTV